MQFGTAAGRTARRVRGDGFAVALGRAAETGLPVTLTVRNAGAIQVHTGPVRRLKQVGPWFNVLDPGFSLHLLSDSIASTWVLRAATGGGFVTSIEIFAADGSNIASLAGRREPASREERAWQDVATSLPAEDPAAT